MPSSGNIDAFRRGKCLGAAFGLALIALIAPAMADEAVDPISGRLTTSATDVVAPGGAVFLPAQRSLGGGSELFGARWRFNWDSRVTKSGDKFILTDGGIQVEFIATGSQYKAEGGAILTSESTGFTLHRADLMNDSFDSQGRLIGRDFGNGNRVAVKYDAAGKLNRIEGPHGSFLAFTLDGSGQVTRIVSSNGDTAAYTYAGNELVGIDVSSEAPVRYAYANGRLVRIEDAASGRVEIAYDNDGRVTERRWADGTAERWERDDKMRSVRRIDPGGAVTTWTTSADGKQREQIDPLGRKTVTQYDQQTRPVTITQPDGKTSLFAYDAQGRLSRAEEANGRATTISYLGGTGLTSSIVTSDGLHEAFEYDRFGNLTALKLNGETIATLTYTADGLIASRTARGSPLEGYEYDANGRLAGLIDADGQRTRYEHDAQGHLLRVTDPTGGVTAYGYDGKGRLVTETGPNGATAHYDYDAARRLVARTAPDGTRETYQYDGRGRRVAVVDAAGRRAELIVDPAQGLVTQRNADGTQRLRRINALGQVIESSDARGRLVRYEYGPTGLLAAEHRPDGQTLNYHYDRENRLIAIDDGIGGRTRYAWSGSLIIAMADAVGAVTYFANDAQGRLVGTTDPLGGQRRITYGGGNSPIEVRTAAGDDARYSYDAAARLLSVRDPAGGETLLDHDAAGRIVAITRPDGTVLRHTYDKAGSRVATTDGSGRSVTYAYDASGKLVGKTLPDGASMTFRYGVGNALTDVDDKRFPIHRTLDAQGRVTAIQWPSINKSLAFAYDALGSMTHLTGSAGQTVQYRYDNLRRLAAITLPAGGDIAFGYDAAGRVQQIRYPNGTSGTYRYGPTGAVQSLAWTDRGGQVLAAWTYSHDAAGNVTAIARANAPTLTYRYDADGRLTEEKAGTLTPVTYAYLPGGDRAKVSAGARSVAYSYDKGRLAAAGGERFAYGPLGEITGRDSAAGKTSYQYDAEGNLTHATLPGGAVVTFAYDANGNRISRSDVRGQVYFLTNDRDLIEEVGANGTSQAFYIYGPGIDWPLAMMRGGQTYFYHADAQGNVALLSDAQGRVAARYDTDAFGRVAGALPQLANPFIFAGREYEPALGLYYFRARYYDPALGRFISADPMLGKLGDPATLNRYAYAFNAPTRFKDPLGLGPDLIPQRFPNAGDRFAGWGGTEMQVRQVQNQPPSDIRIDFDYWQKKGFSRGQLLGLVNKVRTNIASNSDYVAGYGGNPPSGAQLDADSHWLVERALSRGQIYEADGTPTLEHISAALDKPQDLPGWQSQVAVPVARGVGPGPAPGAADGAGANTSNVVDAGRNTSTASGASGNQDPSAFNHALDDAPGTSSNRVASPLDPLTGGSAIDPRVASPSEPIGPGPSNTTLNIGTGQPPGSNTLVNPIRPGGAPPAPAGASATLFPSRNDAGPSTSRPGGVASFAPEPGIGTKLAGGTLAGAVVGGTLAGANCALDGADLRQCGAATGKGMLIGGAAGLVTTAVVLAAPATAPLVVGAGILGTAYTGYQFVGKTVNVAIFGTTASQVTKSSGALAAGDAFIAGLQRRQDQINQLVGPARSPSDQPASIRDMMAQAQALAAQISTLVIPKSGAAFSTADQQRRAAEDLSVACTKTGEILTKVEAADTDALATVRQINIWMADLQEPPASTPSVKNASAAAQKLAGQIGAVSLLVQPLPELMSSIKADFSALRSGPDANDILAKINAYDQLATRLQTAVGQLHQAVASFQETQLNDETDYVAMRDQVRLSTTGAENTDMAAYEARLTTISNTKLNIGSVEDDAFNIVKKSDADVARWKNALNLEPGGPAAQGAQKACVLGASTVDVTSTVQTAGGDLRGLTSDLDGLQGAFQARAAKLNEIAKIDQNITANGPGLIAEARRRGKPDEADGVQKLINNAKARQELLPQEIAAVQQAAQSVSTSKAALAKVVGLFGSAAQ